MDGALSRFAAEWSTASLLVWRVGAPFVAGLYDVDAQVGASPEKRVTLVSVSSRHALLSALTSVTHDVIARFVALGLCFALDGTGVPALRDAAVEGESAGRRAAFGARQLLALLSLPAPALDALVANLSPAAESARFTDEASAPRVAQVALRTLARTAVTEASASLHVTATWLLRRWLRPTEPVARFLADASTELNPVRTWQLWSVLGCNASRVVGGTVGAAAAAALLSRGAGGAGHRSPSLSAVVLCGGEFVGGALAMAAFSCAFAKYRPLAQAAIADEDEYIDTIDALARRPNVDESKKSGAEAVPAAAPAAAS